jgi:enoyl-CoA hydratase
VSEYLAIDIRDMVATITINRPEKLNTFTIDMARETGRLARQINLDDGVRAVIIRATGDRAFSAGSDIKTLDAFGNNWHLRNRFDSDADYPINVWSIRKPVISSIRGYCIGGGLEIAMASDIRVASQSAKFGAGEIRLGWHGGSGETQFLRRLVGPGMAMRMLLTGDLIDAQEALRIGLVQQLTSEEELDGAALKIATRIAQNPPIAVQLTKHIVRMADGMSIDAGLSYENDLNAYCFTTQDSKEGIAAFLEKREPQFRGE